MTTQTNTQSSEIETKTFQITFALKVTRKEIEINKKVISEGYSCLKVLRSLEKNEKVLEMIRWNERDIKEAKINIKMENKNLLKYQRDLVGMFIV